MEPTHHSAVTQQVPVPLQAEPDDHSPLALAKRMVRYNDIYCAEGDIVRAQPALMKSISQQLQAAGQEVPLGSNSIPDPQLALQFYDFKLNETPNSFQDHYLRLHYATSATILLDLSVIGPLGANNLAFFQEYHKIYMKLLRESKARYKEQKDRERLGHPTPPAPTPLGDLNPDPTLSLDLPTSARAPRAPPTASPTLTHEQAEELVRSPLSTFRKMKFHTLGGGDPDMAGEWRFSTFISHEDGEEEYMIHFDELDCSIPYSRAGVVGLLTESYQVPS